MPEVRPPEDDLTDDTTGPPEEVLVELRRRIFARLAITRQDGSLVLCPCSRARVRHGSRPKITYAEFEDARMAARELVRLPRAVPIRLYPCVYNPEHWHLTTRLGKGKAGRKLTFYPPGRQPAS